MRKLLIAMMLVTGCWGSSGDVGPDHVSEWELARASCQDYSACHADAWEEYTRGLPCNPEDSTCRPELHKTQEETDAFLASVEACWGTLSDLSLREAGDAGVVPLMDDCEELDERHRPYCDAQLDRCADHVAGAH